jgi:hypothetical protein
MGIDPWKFALTLSSFPLLCRIAGIKMVSEQFKEQFKYSKKCFIHEKFS